MPGFSLPSTAENLISSHDRSSTNCVYVPSLPSRWCHAVDGGCCTGGRHRVRGLRHVWFGPEQFGTTGLWQWCCFHGLCLWLTQGRTMNASWSGSGCCEHARLTHTHRSHGHEDLTVRCNPRPGLDKESGPQSRKAFAELCFLERSCAGERLG